MTPAKLKEAGACRKEVRGFGIVDHGGDLRQEGRVLSARRPELLYHYYDEALASQSRITVKALPSHKLARATINSSLYDAHKPTTYIKTTYGDGSTWED